MNERTLAYLRGRFGDHYRRSAVGLPPAASAREWGFIPFTVGPGTTMVRHKGLVDLGDISTFLVDECPRHVYFSAGRYDAPNARDMATKGWRGSDLIFDLDGDHLPSIDPDTDTYAAMLAACKDALLRLLDVLHDDFGLDTEQTSVVFSGGRGYHVHVRDERILTLGRDARREIVEYVIGAGIDELDSLTHSQLVAGMGMKTPAEKKTLQTAGGWGRRVHSRLMELTETVQTIEQSDAIDRLRAFDGIGEKGANKLYETMTQRAETLAAGNLEVGGNPTQRLVERLLTQTVEAESVPIDEPVTTDINRLIRLPGSLHGGSGLVVTPLSHEETEAFDPLVDAVPATFEETEITIESTTKQRVELGGETHKIPAGNCLVRESVGVFLMARGRAEKAPE